VVTIPWVVNKKNSSTLKNLIEWLKDYNARRGGKTVDAADEHRRTQLSFRAQADPC
jgi:hypothetical protein